MILSVCKCILERAKEKHWGSCWFYICVLLVKESKRSQARKKILGENAFVTLIWSSEIMMMMMIYVSLCHQTTFLLLKMSTKAAIHLRMRNYALWDYISDICVIWGHIGSWGGCLSVILVSGNVIGSRK